MPTFSGHGETSIENDISENCWSEIAALILSNIEANSFCGAYPATCPDDPHQTCGTNTETLYVEFSAHALPSPSESVTVPAARDILHLVRFVHRRLGKAKPIEYHEARSHHHLNVDEYLGKLEFRQKINGIFARYGTTYQMDETGHITRLEPKEPGHEEEKLQRHETSPSATDPRSVNVNRRPPKAFISHATLDHPFVEKFAADLRANGVDAWFSKWEIKPGDSIRAKIEEGLEGCEDFIIVLSKNSINRPWVQTELDSATIRKLNGKVRKIIPVKIEDCGDLPPTLAALLWEDFSRQDYEVALKRVLDSIFEADLRPPLGKPPAYVRAEVFPMEGLAPNDRLILEALCRNTIATGFALIDDIAPVVEALKKQGISEQQIVETQDLLEELGYVKLRRTAGPAHPYCQTVTQLGFEKFANARISGFQNLIDTVRQRVLVQGDQLENAELAKALGQPLRIVSHVLEVMEDRGWITLTREIGGGYESLRVDLVSPSLKHR
jgi:hypothetical protein